MAIQAQHPLYLSPLSDKKIDFNARLETYAQNFDDAMDSDVRVKELWEIVANSFVVSEASSKSKRHEPKKPCRLRVSRAMALLNQLALYGVNTSVSFVCYKLSNIFIDGVDLTGADLRCTKLESAMFRECTLDLANFTRSEMKDIKFLKCKLRGANFTDSDLRRSAFVLSDLANAIFFSANLEGGRWIEVKMAGIKLSPPSIPCEGYLQIASSESGEFFALIKNKQKKNVQDPEPKTLLLEIWSILKCALLRVLEIPKKAIGKNEKGLYLTFSEDGKYLALGHPDGEVSLFSWGLPGSEVSDPFSEKPQFVFLEPENKNCLNKSASVTFNKAVFHNDNRALFLDYTYKTNRKICKIAISCMGPMFVVNRMNVSTSPYRVPGHSKELFLKDDDPEYRLVTLPERAPLYKNNGTVFYLDGPNVQELHIATGTSATLTRLESNVMISWFEINRNNESSHIYFGTLRGNTIFRKKIGDTFLNDEVCLSFTDTPNKIISLNNGFLCCFFNKKLVLVRVGDKANFSGLKIKEADTTSDEEERLLATLAGLGAIILSQN